MGFGGTGVLTAALVGSGTVAPARGTTLPGRVADATAESRCRCGHAADAHEHFRPGRDCGACGADRCGRFRAARAG